MTRPIVFLIDKPDVSEISRQLVDALRACGASVETRSDAPTTELGDAYLLVPSSSPPEWMHSLPSPRREECLARVFLLECIRPPAMFTELEENRVLGGIAYLVLKSWASGAHNTGYGIAGLRSVVGQIGGKPAPSFASDHYTVYGSTKAESLPAALVEYLDGVARLGI